MQVSTTKEAAIAARDALGALCWKNRRHRRPGWSGSSRSEDAETAFELYWLLTSRPTTEEGEELRLALLVELERWALFDSTASPATPGDRPLDMSELRRMVKGWAYLYSQPPQLPLLPYSLGRPEQPNNTTPWAD